MPEGVPAQARQDKLLTCVDCGAQFVFSVRDQAFYLERGYQAPRRCKTCRDKRKTSPHQILGPQGGSGAGPANAQSAAGAASAAKFSQPGGAVPPPAEDGKQRDQFKVTCSGCGAETTVPFKPDPNRPVYCRTCYLNRRKGGGKPGPGKPAQAPAAVAEKGEAAPQPPAAAAPAAPAPAAPAPAAPAPAAPAPAAPAPAAPAPAAPAPEEPTPPAPPSN